MALIWSIDDIECVPEHIQFTVLSKAAEGALQLNRVHRDHLVQCGECRQQLGILTRDQVKKSRKPTKFAA